MTVDGTGSSATVGNAIRSIDFISVIAKHESLRRSLVALLGAWGLEARSFRTPGDFVEYSRCSEGHAPSCILIDVDHLDAGIPAVIDELKAIDGGVPMLLLHGPMRTIPQNCLDRYPARLSILLKPYRMSDLSQALKYLLASDDRV